MVERVAAANFRGGYGVAAAASRRAVEGWAFFLEQRNKDLEEKRESEVSVLKRKYDEMLEGKTEEIAK